MGILGCFRSLFPTTPTSPPTTPTTSKRQTPLSPTPPTLTPKKRHHRHQQQQQPSPNSRPPARTVAELHPEYAHSEPYHFDARTESARLVVAAAYSAGKSLLVREDETERREMERHLVNDENEDKHELEEIGSLVSSEGSGNSKRLQTVKGKRRRGKEDRRVGEKGQGRKGNHAKKSKKIKKKEMERDCSQSSCREIVDQVDGDARGDCKEERKEVVRGVYSGDGEFIMTDNGLVQVGRVGDDNGVGDGKHTNTANGHDLNNDNFEKIHSGADDAVVDHSAHATLDEGEAIGVVRPVETEGSFKTFKPFGFTSPTKTTHPLAIDVNPKCFGETIRDIVSRNTSIVSEENVKYDDDEMMAQRNNAEESLGTTQETVKVADGPYRMQRKENNSTSLPKSTRKIPKKPLQSSLKRHDSSSSTGSAPGVKKTVSFREEKTIIDDEFQRPSPKTTPSTKVAKVSRRDGGTDVSPVRSGGTISLSLTDTGRRRHSPHPSASFGDRPPASASPARRPNSNQMMTIMSLEELEAARAASTRRQSMAVRDAMTQQIRGIPRSAMLAYEENTFSELKVNNDQDLITPVRSSMHFSSSTLRPRARSSLRKSMRPPPTVMDGVVPPPPPPPPFSPKRLRVKSVRTPPPPPPPIASVA